MKNTIKLIGFIALLAIIGFTCLSCNNSSGGGNPEFYAVYYTISDGTHTTLETSHKTNFSNATLTFVKAQTGSVLVSEKRGTPQEVINFLSGLSLSPDLTSVSPIPTVNQLDNASVGALCGWWPAAAAPKYFVYLERSK